jgi:hypothetical protein
VIIEATVKVTCDAARVPGSGGRVAMSKCCSAFYPEIHEASCGCKDEICMNCGALVILALCDDHYREHFGA